MLCKSVSSMCNKLLKTHERFVHVFPHAVVISMQPRAVDFYGMPRPSAAQVIFSCAAVVPGA
jgi:hypothetical protein